jgi:hypothetical protein
MMIVTNVKKNSSLKFDLELHFKVKLRPEPYILAKSLKIFFFRNISTRSEQKAVS